MNICLTKLTWPFVMEQACLLSFIVKEDIGNCLFSQIYADTSIVKKETSAYRIKVRNFRPLDCNHRENSSPGR